MFNILRNTSFIFAIILCSYMVIRGIYLNKKKGLIEMIDGIEVYCDKCGRYVEAEIIEIRESDDAYKEVHCKCSNCGKKHVVKLMV